MLKKVIVSMKYPRSLVNGSTIGVCAPSAGVGRKIDEYDLSLEKLRENGFTILETESVRINSYVSNSSFARAKELNDLIVNDNVDMIMCATGGDFCVECLPLINFENIKNNPKWIMGASDPTSILYYITTKLDIATLYGHNAGSYDANNLHVSNLISLDYIKGNIVKQNSYPMYESDKTSRTSNGYILDTPVVYENIFGDVDVSGRIIGGCIDVLKDIIGTKFDSTDEFLKRYEDDGIIWYFDNYAQDSIQFYRTLLQFKEAGWFKNTKAILVGRVMFPSKEFGLDYQDVLRRAFEGMNIPVVYNMDIGHVVPKMTIINGAICHVISKNGKGSLEFELR